MMYPCTIPPNGFHQEDRHRVGEKSQKSINIARHVEKTP